MWYGCLILPEETVCSLFVQELINFTVDPNILICLQVELHVHLAGALRIQTIIELAKYATLSFKLIDF